jgi:hypothetical protein
VEPVKKMKKIILILLLSVGITYLGLRYYEIEKDKSICEAKGQVLIEKVEDFKTKNKILPDTDNFGKEYIVEDVYTEPFYKKVDDNSYIIYFNFGFDTDTYIYDSKTRTWKFSNE